MNVTRLGKVIDCREYANFVTSQIRWHKSDFIMPNETLPIEISRGCIFRCKFCAFPLNGKSKGEWVKHYEVLKDEMIYNYETYGTTKYIFADDTYNDSAEKITELYEQVFSKLPFKLEFSSYIRIDLMHRFRETADVLEKSGLKSALLGIETNNLESGKAIGKGLIFEKQMDYIRELKQKQFKDTLVTSGFIFGLPNDTKESLNDLENFLISDQNPLDDWLCKPLGLNPVDKSKHKNYFSEFDLNHEQYGYELIGNDNSADIYRMKWRLKGSDLDYDYCLDQANRVNRISNSLPNFKFGAQEYARISTLIPREEVVTMSRSTILAKYNMKSLIFNYLEQYYKNLFNY
jgi:hypothetical protein